MHTGISIFLPGALENTPAEIFQAKIRCMLGVLKSLETTSRPLFIWCDSFLEVGDKYLDDLPALLANIEEQPTAFVTLSTNGANHFGQLAEKILTLTLPPRTTDAELLNRILPWGSRTRLFGHGAKELKRNPAFFFCYVKPLHQYPPIRVEVPAKIPPDEVDAHIDRVMAHVILNPNIL